MNPGSRKQCNLLQTTNHQINAQPVLASPFLLVGSNRSW